jgi:hypothetical protein
MYNMIRQRIDHISSRSTCSQSDQISTKVL